MSAVAVREDCRRCGGAEGGPHRVLAPVELGRLPGAPIAGGTPRTSDLGGYRPAACPHDPAFQAMESTGCSYCEQEWPWASL